MADRRIIDLPRSQAISGEEVIPVDITDPTTQQVTTESITVNQIKELIGQEGSFPIGTCMWDLTNGNLKPGWALCDGSAFDTVRYAELATLFPGGNLPDVRGRYIVSAGLSGYAPGELEEAKMPAHTHTYSGTVTEEPHDHAVTTSAASVSLSGAVNFRAGVLDSADGIFSVDPDSEVNAWFAQNYTNSSWMGFSKMNCQLTATVTPALSIASHGGSQKSITGTTGPAGSGTELRPNTIYGRLIIYMGVRE